MKITFCNVVSTSLLIVFMFPSCIPSIRIVGGDTATHALNLRDAKGNSAETFMAHPGQKINWKIIKHLKVSSITAMPQKNKGENDIFSRDPHKKILSKKWKGKIDKKAKGVEYYNIEWTDEDGGGHTYDPKIQVQ